MSAESFANFGYIPFRIVYIYYENFKYFYNAILIEII